MSTSTISVLLVFFWNRRFDKYTCTLFSILAPLADEGIEKMSNFLQDKWKELAFKLDFEEDVIEAIEMDIPDDKERALGVLEKWRLSDFAIEKDTNIVRYLHEVMLGIGCSEELLLLLKQRI